jgi:hypothetical protein
MTCDEITKGRFKTCTINERFYRKGGGDASGETSEEVRKVVTKYGIPFRCRCDTRVDHDGDDRY